jgi:hypothetical protein
VNLPWGKILFALFFFFGFGFVGVFSAVSIGKALHTAYQARHWKPVSATVEQVSVDRGSKGTARVTARFTYEYDGLTFTGSRIGIVDISDNIGDWQRTQFDYLRNAKERQQPIQVWVDPITPARSVVDRELRWGLLAFMLPFAVVFSLISIGAGWYIIKLLQSTGDPLARFSRRPTSNLPELRSDARSLIIGRWAWAVIWNVIAFPIAFGVSSSPSDQAKHGLAIYWVWLFPLIGMGFLRSAIVQSINLRTNGDLTLTLHPKQPRVGAPIDCRFEFEKEPEPSAFAVSLACEHVDERNEDTKVVLVWKQEKTVMSSANQLRVQFQVPPGLPTSTKEGRVYHRWRLLVHFPEQRDERRFDLVVGEVQLAMNSQQELV